jgi:hypothetical protein
MEFLEFESWKKKRLRKAEKKRKKKKRWRIFQLPELELGNTSAG